MNKFLKLNLQFFAADTGMSFQTKEGVQLTATEFLEYKKLQKEQETKNNRPFVGNGTGGTKTAGQIFVQSEAYKSFLSNGQNSSDNVAIPAFTKAIVTSRDVNGALMGEGRIIGQGQQPMRLRDLLAVATTQNNAIDYIKEVGFLNSSAIAPETTLKPQSDISFEAVTSLVRTIAHWIPASRQSIADIPSLQNHIDNRLLYGLAITEEAQILYGDGTGDNLEGLMVNPNIQTYSPLVDDTKLETIRKAMTRTLLAGYPSTGIVLHPNDWEDIELLKGNDGHYVFSTISTGAETRLFRVPVVLSTSILEGEFLTGAFGLGAQLFDREAANVRISEHHADYFARNMLAILCEERLALATYRPEAFVKGVFEAAPVV